jgi:PAS domain S-box-containing protein
MESPDTAEKQAMYRWVTPLFRLGMACLCISFLLTFSQVYDLKNALALSKSDSTDKPLRTIIVPDYYPYTHVNDQGMPDGFSVDLAKAVAHVMDRTLDISVGTWEQARQALENETVDFLPMMAASSQRGQVFDFSVPHTIAYDALFVRANGLRISSLNDLAGRTVIVMNKDAAHDFLLGLPVAGTIRLILVDSLPEGLRLLASGTGDAAIMPKLVGLLLVKKLGIKSVEESAVTIQSYKRPFSFAVKKENKTLLESLSQGLSLVEASGQYRDIYDKWFGVVAPRGLPWKLIIRYAAVILAGCALILIILLAWTLSLRRMVAQRTESLESEIEAHKKSEIALRESEERRRLAQDAAKAGTWEWDLRTNENFWSDELWTLYGLVPNSCQPSYDAWIQSIHPNDRPTVECAVQEAALGGNELNTEWRTLGLDGSVRWLMSRGRPVCDENGNPLRYIGIVVDITDRKRAENDLHRANQEWERTFNNISDGIMILDDEHKIVRANNAMADALGKPESELIGKFCFNLVHGEKKPPAFCPHSQLLADGQPHVAEVTEPLLGATLDVRVSPILDAEGLVVGSIHVIRDITTRKQAENELQQSRDLLRAIIDAAPTPIFGLDLDGNVQTVWNPASEKMLGWTADEVMGRPLPSVPAESTEEFTRFREMIRSDKTLDGVQVHRKRRDGSPIDYAIYASPLHDAEGRISGNIALLVDVTERKRFEQALQDSEERLRMTLEATQVGIWDWDVKNDQWHASPTYYTMLGYEPTTESGNRQEWLERVHPDDRACVNKKIQSVLKGKSNAYEYEARLRHVDGTYRWQYVRGLSVDRDKAGQVGRMLGIRIDVDTRKRYEKALQTAGEYNRSLIEASLDPLVTISSEGKITDVNTATECVTGYSRQELIGTDFADYFSDPQEARAGYQQAFKVGSVKDYALNIRHKNGKSTPVLYNASVYRDRSGEILGLFVAARDITELRNAQERTAEKIRFQRLLMDAIPNPIFFGDRECKFLGCNEAFSKFLGRSEAEIFGRSVFEVYADNCAEIYHAKDSDLLVKGGTEALETRVRSAEGSEHDVIFYKSTFPEPDGTVGGFIGVFLDITEQKQAQLRLSESEAFYRSMYENTSDCIFIIDVTPDGSFKFVSFNPAEERATGMTTEQVANKSPEDLVSKDFAAHVNSRYQTCVEKRETIHYEEELDLANGKVTFSTSLVPLEGPDGRIHRIIGVGRDMSEQKKLQKQLLQAQKMEAIGTLAGGVAHDFNNVLQVVLGYSELLLSDMDLPPVCLSDLLKIHEAAKRGADLVQRLLTFSRKTEVKPQPLNLNSRIEDLRKMIERTIPKMIALELSLGENLHTINADPTQMDQVLMNLLVNARDAMPEGGRLTIETSNILLDEEYTRTNLMARPGHHVLLIVSDTGTGMAKDTLEHIFEPFYTTKGQVQGTGLGLAMVHGILKQHGGHIQCHSVLGNGTTFKLYFPALLTDEVLEETRVVEMPQGGTETILLVDDEKVICDLGSRILMKAGYNVITASNGREALEVYQTTGQEIDLIILDLVMPEMGGRKCLESLLNLNPFVKVIIASGYYADAVSREALVSAAKGFVNKPFDIKQVLEVVREVLDRG